MGLQRVGYSWATFTLKDASTHGGVLCMCKWFPTPRAGTARVGDAWGQWIASPPWAAGSFSGIPLGIDSGFCMLTRKLQGVQCTFLRDFFGNSLVFRGWTRERVEERSRWTPLKIANLDLSHNSSRTDLQFGFYSPLKLYAKYCMNEWRCILGNRALASDSRRDNVLFCFFNAVFYIRVFKLLYIKI